MSGRRMVTIGAAIALVAILTAPFVAGAAQGKQPSSQGGNAGVSPLRAAGTGIGQALRTVEVRYSGGVLRVWAASNSGAAGRLREVLSVDLAEEMVDLLVGGSRSSGLDPRALLRYALALWALSLSVASSRSTPAFECR